MNTSYGRWASWALIGGLLVLAAINVVAAFTAPGSGAAARAVQFALAALAIPTITSLICLPAFVRKLIVSRRNPGAFVVGARAPDFMRRSVAASRGLKLGWAPTLLVASDRIEFWVGVFRVRPVLVYWRKDVVDVEVITYRERYYAQATGIELSHPNGKRTVFQLGDPWLGAMVATPREIANFVGEAKRILGVDPADPRP